MKVIVASMPKSGTKTLATCLRELGYTVYDALEHIQYHTADWDKIFAGKATTQDIQRMYKDVDAVTDIPACGLWEEISIAFPDAKVRKSGFFISFFDSHSTNIIRIVSGSCS